MNATKILGNSSFWITNKHIARYFKANDCAVLLADFLDKRDYFQNSGQLQDDGFFYNTRESIEEDTNISPDMQRKYITALVNEGVLETRKKGLPARIYYKINDYRILEILSLSRGENGNSSRGEIQQLEWEKSNTNNNKYNNNKLNNKNKKKEKKSFLKSTKKLTNTLPIQEGLNTLDSLADNLRKEIAEGQPASNLLQENKVLSNNNHDLGIINPQIPQTPLFSGMLSRLGDQTTLALLLANSKWKSIRRVERALARGSTTVYALADELKIKLTLTDQEFAITKSLQGYSNQQIEALGKLDGRNLTTQQINLWIKH